MYPLYDKLLEKATNSKTISITDLCTSINNINNLPKKEDTIEHFTEIYALILYHDYVNKFYINYSYDRAGNLQNKYEQVLDPTYGYPTGTQNGNTYEYTDTSWKDKLTKVNGSNISYDEIGNPFTYRDGMSMTWKNGR